MNRKDIPVFIEAMNQASLKARKPLPSERELKEIGKELRNETIQDVVFAIRAHIRDPDRGRFPPGAADILAKLGEIEGRPSEKRAWALCVALKDNVAYVTNDEIIEMLEEVHPLLIRQGQGAMGAAVEAYRKIGERKRKAGLPPVWKFTSRVWDEYSKNQAMLEALRLELPPSVLRKLNASHYLDRSSAEERLKLPNRMPGLWSSEKLKAKGKLAAIHKKYPLMRSRNYGLIEDKCGDK